MRHLAAFEIRKGHSRGDHYHEKKEEIFYIFQGKIKASFVDVDTLQKEEKIFENTHKCFLTPETPVFCHG
jgi:dTDP-4-dehydrorhamnose 3,5-epimerase-like enzyme